MGLSVQRVITAWLRQAISKEYVEELLAKVKEEDLPFDHIFEGRRRIAIDPEKYGKLPSKPGYAEDFETLLRQKGLLQKGDKIDWQKGLIVGREGKTKMRLGKALSKAINKGLSKEDKEFLALSKKIESRKGKVQKHFDEYWNSWKMLRLLKAFHWALHEGYDEAYSDVDDFVHNDTVVEPAIDPKAWEKLSKLAKDIEGMSFRQFEELLDKYDRRMYNFQQEMRRTQPTERQRKIARLIGRANITIPTYQTERKVKALQRKIINGAQDIDEFYQSEGGQLIKEYFDRKEQLTPGDRRAIKKVRDLQEMQEDYNHWKSIYGNPLSLVISRDPVDVLRMSDHPDAIQAIESCHSEGSSYFQCAIDEAEDGGLVSYLVKKEDIEGKDLDEGELFEDKKRGVKGIKPLARLRFRRYEADTPEGGLEIAVPEEKVYGANVSSLVDIATEWARQAQPEFTEGLGKAILSTPGVWRLTGGAYQDTDAVTLFENFLGRVLGEDDEEEEDKFEDYQKERKVKPWKEADVGAFWEWMNKNHPKVPNPNMRSSRKKEITPNTLKSYARGRGGYSDAARSLVKRYIAQWKASRKDAA